ncbi:MAG: hypothetical protein V5A64_06850 [Candidatus Thermoplasmatota archaeon]
MVEFNIYETKNLEDSITPRGRDYRYIIKILFIGSIFLSVVTAFMILGDVVFGPNWLFFPIEIWLYFLVSLLVLFAVLELVFFQRYKSSISTVRDDRREKPRYIDGRRVYVYTFPKGAKGGVFSKTFIPIDENSVLLLRCRMVHPDKISELTP